MADVIQFKLEKMLDELDDVVKRGIFTKPEASMILKKRRDFEYRLKRPCSLKQDYLAYIHYEKQLDALRRLRKKASRRQDTEDENKRKRKKSLSDFTGVLRILETYKRAVTRFKGDLNIWFEYLEFCRERGHGRMKRALAQALRFHPNVPGLWIYAAAWEFGQNLNVAAARALMQRGLRACPWSEDLWVEYLRMELTYLNKLKARKLALGNGSGSSVKVEEDDWKEQNKDLFMSLDNGDEKSNDGDIQEAKVDEDLDAKAKVDEDLDALRKQGSDIIRTIYDAAVESLPHNLSLCKKFIEILENADVANMDGIKEDMTSSIHKEFLRDESYWDWLARRELSRGDKERTEEDMLCQLNKAVQVYEEALSVVPSPKLFELYAALWSEIIASEGGSEVVGFSNLVSNVPQFISTLLEVYEKAESCGCMTPDLALQYISMYLKLGKLEEARKLAAKLCIGGSSGKTKLWLGRLLTEIKWVTTKSAAISKDDQQSLFELFKCILTKLTIPEAESLWLMALKIFSNQRDHIDKLVEICLRQLAGGGDCEACGSVSCALLNCALQRGGIQRARDIYKQFLALPHPSLGIYKCCIELESNLASLGDGRSLQNARKLHESCLSFYGQNAGLWRDYYFLELKVGTPKTASAIYWRAKKTLFDASELFQPCHP
ncbi:hypothetical protein AMTRI_Chr06g200810 [Amborella trichopoda]|uniref:U3 small nucleolar RNA-associated protein 6 homolog n=1 Tax=Amborella trichopoda TaxID=13333 RepID=U5DCR1_AMBTC|nr:U3 small nucleolar RNA-associated protein 6 homolog [Amborella trichopoda]ERN20324.1 hypothetical protein AMTR_s00066p00189300 [Amborella trichopoda]|eukprot:XP_006858857.1 U3 small nucleolar RNA-associated protein 6 homolog [Amborella trichopoda]